MRIIVLAALATASIAIASPSFAEACNTDAQFSAAARQNESTLRTAALAPFGRGERGWRIYEPQIAHAIGTGCAADTSAFAAALAAWQRDNRLASTGKMDATTLSALKQYWQHARPFAKKGFCPQAASDDELADVAGAEAYAGKQAQLSASALAALRQMTAAAKRENPEIAADPRALTVVSAFRSPAYDAARCARDRNCNGVSRARCSPHRTGKAMDLFVGAAPGQSPVSSADTNRLYQSQTATYRWLVANADRFGFVNYVFEPWHWEWTGAPARVATVVAHQPRAKPLP